DEAGELYYANYYDGRIFRIDGPRQAPRISSEGVVDAATFAAGPIAPGSIVSIFGAALADGVAEAAQTPLPTTLQDVRFEFGGTPAPVFFVSPGQVNIQVPWGLAGSTS